MILLTIGHSNHTIEQFVQLLQDNGIQMVVDVRSSPYSRYNPHFNREFLESTLKHRQILYKYEGKDLGGRPPDPSCYKKRELPKKEEGSELDYLHEVDYPEVMRKAWFKKGIERLIALAEEQTTTILCSEEDPAQCHRHHLIVRYLFEAYPDVTVQHIRGDGKKFNARTLLKTISREHVEQYPLL
jgi:uncharacterized protein (DUF488 family)